MKKRNLLLIISIVLALAVSLGSTMAYLSDTDSDVNVMTLGSVYIDQMELQRKDGIANNATLTDGDLELYTNGQPLYPAVPNGDAAYEVDANPIVWGNYTSDEGASNKLWKDDALAGAMDKFVFVKNTGKSEAYIRTLIAMEMPEEIQQKDIILILRNEDGIEWQEHGAIELNGTRYVVYSATYEEALAAGAVSLPSLLQVAMTHEAGNEDMELLGDEYEILIVSQAMQAYNMQDMGASKSLDLGFGELNTDNLTKWFADAYEKEGMPVTMVDTVQELISAIQAGDKHIMLTGDIILDKPVDYDFMSKDGNGSPLYAEHKESGITLDLNGYNIIATEEALLEGKTNSNGTILVRYSTLNIKGTGSIITENQSMCVYGWAYSDINIYGGTYISNASERNESAIYVNNTTVMIHVYGGDFTQCDYAFNVHDKCGNTAVITLHEGIEFKQFLKNGTVDVIGADIDAGRIVAAEGCVIETTEVDGQIWYKVVKK